MTYERPNPEVITSIDRGRGEDCGAAVQMERQPDGSMKVLRVLFDISALTPLPLKR